MNTYSIVILGAGIIAESHIRAAQNLNHVQISALADLDTERAKALCNRFSLQAAVYADYQQMIVETKPDIAILCLPHFLHLPAAQFCLENGCHLLLEKPMAMNTDECDRIIALANAYRRVLMVGHVIHYYPETQILKKLVQSQELGKLLMVNDYRCCDYFTDSRPGWFLNRSQSGGGMLLNLGAHSVDRVLWVTGRQIIDQQSTIIENMPGMNVEGYANVNLTLEGNIPAHITVYGYQVYNKNTLELFFEGGVAEARFGEGVWLTQNGVTKKIEETFEEPFYRQLADFIGCLEGGENPIPGEYGRRVIACIEQCYRQNGL